MAYRMRKARHLRNMSTEHLRERLQEIAITQFAMRGRQKAGLGANPGQWRNIKKEKARILTILRERELQEGKR